MGGHFCEVWHDQNRQVYQVRKSIEFNFSINSTTYFVLHNLDCTTHRYNPLNDIIFKISTFIVEKRDFILSARNREEEVSEKYGICILIVLRQYPNSSLDRYSGAI